MRDFRSHSPGTAMLLSPFGCTSYYYRPNLSLSHHFCLSIWLQDDSYSEDHPHIMKKTIFNTRFEIPALEWGPWLGIHVHCILVHTNSSDLHSWSSKGSECRLSPWARCLCPEKWEHTTEDYSKEQSPQHTWNKIWQSKKRVPRYTYQGVRAWYEGC